MQKTGHGTCVVSHLVSGYTVERLLLWVTEKRANQMLFTLFLRKHLEHHVPTTSKKICTKSMDLRSHAEKLSRDNIKYSDYALSVLSIEETEADSESYAAVKVGVSEWIVRRVGIITDKVHTVTSDSGELKCSCLHFEECGIICRHMHCVTRQDARFDSILTKQCINLWENINFINVFNDFEVLMPSLDEICATSGEMFPGPFGIPKRVAQRGRPKVKQFKMGQTFQFKRKLRGQASQAVGRQCSVCLSVGHNKAACPVSNRFKI